MPVNDTLLLENIAATFASQGRTVNTRKTYATAYRSLLAFLGPGAGPGAVNIASVHAWRVALERSGLAPSTVAVYLSAVRKLAVHLGADPAVRNERGARVVRDAPPTLLPLEVARLLGGPDRRTSVGIRDLALLTLSAKAGLRPSEVVALPCTAVEEHRRHPDRRLRRAVPRSTPFAVRVPGPRTGDRIVPLAADVLPALAAWRDARPPTEAETLFVSLPTISGRTPGRLAARDVGRMVARYGAAAGLPPDLRSSVVLRATFATVLRRNGADLETIADLLGSADLRAVRAMLPAEERILGTGDDHDDGRPALDRL